MYNLDEDGNCNYVSLSQYLRDMTDNNSVKILNYNIRSFNANYDCFSLAFMKSNPPNILILSETWFNEDSTACLTGYQGYHTTRDGRSGGVSVYIDNRYDSNLVPNLSFANLTIEVCTVDVSVNNFKFTIISIYRPHSDSILNFCDFFTGFLNCSHFANKFCIILGDLNICLLKNDNPNLSFANLLFSHNFLPLINRPTHFPRNDSISPSLLDHIFVNISNTRIAMPLLIMTLLTICPLI